MVCLYSVYKEVKTVIQVNKFLLVLVSLVAPDGMEE